MVLSSTPDNYDVFLSFRGEDTREKFTSHLYAALVRKKIKTYIDEVSLERGDEISPALLEAIRKSKISIIVFSKDYASSSWCLSELVHILECHREDKQRVIPIFYEVDSSHIRKQEGSYGEAFLKHQERFKDRLQTVQKWRVALTESANLSGWDSRVERPESKLVEAIVEDVLQKLNRDQSTNFGFAGFVGIEKHIQEIKLLLSVSSPKVRIVGICGMGGIGKTTLAQVLFHELASQFEARCFVPNVREESQKGSLINLRNKLLAELLKEENLNVGTPSLGPTFFKERLQRTKVLIVLDDVNHLQQLNTFIRDLQFSCESRIVITTRDATLLRYIQADEEYEVKPLDNGDALQLFNSIAFNGIVPPGDCSELSQNVVSHAGGVPLAITVLGSHFRSLRSQTKEAWKAALDKLKVIPHADIYNVLRVTFDGLDNTEKDIFLDIACFFKGMRRDYVENLLNGCGFFATNGIDDLIDKSLITVGNNKLWMHDLLEEMGQKIVCEESKKLGERSRLWSAEDACHVLENNEGTAEIQGIFLDLSKIGRDIHLDPTVFKNMCNLRLLKIHNSFNSNECEEYPHHSLQYFLHPLRYPEWHENPLNCKVYLQNGHQYLPHSLRYLEWHKYPLNSLPPNFKPNNLVELKMTYSQLEKLWDGVQDLKKLRCIDLSYSIHLNQIPDLSRAPNLEGINLDYCTSLRQYRIDVPSLRTLTLKGCSNPNALAMIMTTSLVSLNFSSTAIEYLPSSIGSLNSLSELLLNNCTRLANLPSSTKKLDSLRSLELNGCLILEKFPELPCNIQKLKICETAIKEVTSSSIEGCSRLRELHISNCYNLQSILELPSSLEILDARGCESLEVVSYARRAVAHSRHLEAEDEEEAEDRESCFYGCLKLDKKAKDNIVTDFQVKIRNEREGADDMMACYPGNEIPKWFEHRSEGSSIHIKLQPQWGGIATDIKFKSSVHVLLAWGALSSMS